MKVGKLNGKELIPLKGDRNHTVILEYFNMKNKHFLILPSRHRHQKQKEFFKCYDAILK